MGRWLGQLGDVSRAAPSWSCATAVYFFAVSGCSLVVGDVPGPLHDAGANASGGEAGALGNEIEGAAPPAVIGDAGLGDEDAEAPPPSVADDAGIDPCDRDGDGEASEDCGGEDCNDDNRRVFSTQQEYFDEPIAQGGFDYDCSDTIERQDGQLSCALGACDPQTQGFIDDPLPQCGDEGTWGHCEPQDLAPPLPGMCEPQPDAPRRVACR